MKKILLLACILFVPFMINSCVTYKQSEEEILADSKPPAGYSPVFIQGNKPFIKDDNLEKKLIISGVDTRNPNNVKIRFHIVGDDKFFLTGAQEKIFDNIWCLVIDSTEKKIRNLKNKIRQITEDEKQPVSLSVVADHSGSMGEWRANAVQKAIYSLIQDKKDEDFLSVIKYDTKVIEEVTLTDSKDVLRNTFKMEGLSGYGGMTAISDGILAGINSLKNSDKNTTKAVVVFTDGWDNSSSIKADSVFRSSKNTNTNIFSIDFGTDINPGYMKSFSDSCGGYYHHIYNTDEFSFVFNDIYHRLKNGYILEYNPQEYGDHFLKFKLCLPKDTLTANVHFNNTPDLGYIGLLNVYFDFDKAVVKKESDEAIESILNLMKGFPKMTIEIRGHTDSVNATKDELYNVKLSQKRADAVKSMLVKKGIQEYRIKSIGYGEKLPIADNLTEENRALNRRTEFVVITK